MLKYFTIQENRTAIRINPHRFGEHKQSLVFIHGSGGNSGAWLYQYSQLDKAFNIAAINLPGHGESAGTGRQEIREYTLFLREMLGVLSLVNPILIGHSLGAAIALDCAAEFPGLAGGIVPVGGGVTMPVNADMISGFRSQPQIVLDMMCKFSLAKENRPRLYDALRASLGEASVEVTAGDMLACSKFDISPRIAGITTPALVICGTEDKMMPPSASEQIVRSLPGAKLVLIEGAGHMVMMEQPQAFNAALQDFALSLPAV